MSTPDLVSKLAEHGITGLLLAIALYVILKLYQANEKAHADRIADAAVYLEKTSRMVEACTVAITAQAHITEAHKHGLEELHETMKEYADEVRNRSMGRR